MRRNLLDASSFCASGMGAAGRPAGGFSHRSLLVLDELLLGRIDGCAWRGARSGLRGPSFRTAANRSAPPGAGIAVRGFLVDAGDLTALRRLRILQFRFWCTSSTSQCGPRIAGEGKLRFTVLPVAVIGVAGVLMMGYYNQRTTGNPLLLPHILNERTYSPLPLFLWQRPNPNPTFRDPVFAKFFKLTEEEYGYQKTKSISGLIESGWAGVFCPTGFSTWGRP